MVERLTPQTVPPVRRRSALDTKLGEQAMELIVSEVRARHTAAVVVTHDLRMTHYADRTIRIVDGVLEAP